MDILKYKDYEGTAELDMDRGMCRGKLLFIDDLVTYEAATPGDLRHQFEAAVDDYLATCAEVGKEPQRPFRGVFNVRVPRQLHRAAALRAVVDGVTLNEVVVRALDCFLNTRVDVKHNVVVTLEAPAREIQTIRAVVSEPVSWTPSHVH